MTSRFALPLGVPIRNLTDEQRRILFDRGRAHDSDVSKQVAAIIRDVKDRGDSALREQAREFDGARDLRIEIPRAAWQTALDSLAPELRAALELAARNLATFHAAQLPGPLEVTVQPGVVIGRRADPLERVGVYAPGGRAAYPSSVLMGVVPARVAGVREVVVCSPSPSAAVLAACAIGQADRLFAIGGAGAVAAMTFGTDTVPRVDKVVGPGNAYVTEAKRQLSAFNAFDAPAGPSEVLVLAGEDADAELVAWELLAQAEHDPDAAAVLVSTSRALLDAVAAVIEMEIGRQTRGEIMTASLQARGALLLEADLDEMLAFNASYAPEHLALYVDNARELLPKVRNAGTVFLGASTSVAFGDYVSGANHVLPTAGLARSYSGLSTIDFMRWLTYQDVTAKAAGVLSAPTALLADAEGLPAHARAARLREATQPV